jgi:fatty acyl-CoA reductase
LFNRLRKENPGALQKLLPVQGDMTLEELGLTPENKARLQEEVSVVFHCAATLRLEAKLKDAVEMNATGTWRVLQLARGMKQIKVSPSFAKQRFIYCCGNVYVLFVYFMILC